jgi:2-methylaconitate cis-trans-isomerase PrpF
MSRTETTPRDEEPGETTQREIPGRLVRGGTSRGLFVRDTALPEDPDERDAVVLDAFGSPDPIQVDGIGGSHSHTSKLMIVDPGERDGVDVQYTFGQVGIDRADVDWSGNCGNLTSAIGPFAILEGVVDADEPVTELTLYNTNTDTYIEQTVPVEDGRPAVEGDYAIDGIDGTGARVDSEFVEPGGRSLGDFLPRGRRLSLPDAGCEVTAADAANPCVFVAAEDIGVEGTELADVFDSAPVRERVEAVRGEALVELGLAESVETARKERPATPFFIVVSPAADYETSLDGHVGSDEVDLVARAYTSEHPHHAFPMTGAMCLAATVRASGTVPFDAAGGDPGDAVRIGHPKGTVTVGSDVDDGDEVRVNTVTVGRTVRQLMHGVVFSRR